MCDAGRGDVARGVERHAAVAQGMERRRGRCEEEGARARRAELLRVHGAGRVEQHVAGRVRGGGALNALLVAAADDDAQRQVVVRVRRHRPSRGIVADPELQHRVRLVQARFDEESAAASWTLDSSGMKRLMIVLAALALFDRNAWLGDYAALKQALEARYANLAWFASPEGGVDLPALDRRTLAALQSAASDDDAREALLAFVRGFRDGHFSQLPAVEPAPAVQAAPPPNAELSRKDAATVCAALNYAPYNRPQFSLPFESLPGFRLIADGIGTPFRAGIVGGVGIVRIPAFEENADQGLCREAWKRRDVWEHGKLNRNRLRHAVERAWYDALARDLRAFQSGGAKAVVVDIGANSGGDDSGDIAARLFTAKPLHSSPLWLSYDAAAATPYFDA